MQFHETKLEGAFLVEPERIVDDRGFFARSFCRRELERHGLEPAIAQCNISYDEQRGILRGMHFQAAPHEEAKLVRCTCLADLPMGFRWDEPTIGIDWPVAQPILLKRDAELPVFAETARGRRERS